MKNDSLAPQLPDWLNQKALLWLAFLGIPGGLLFLLLQKLGH